jgi:hypothetical protein
MIKIIRRPELNLSCGHIATFLAPKDEWKQDMLLVRRMCTAGGQFSKNAFQKAPAPRRTDKRSRILHHQRPTVTAPSPTMTRSISFTFPGASYPIKLNILFNS